MDISTTSRLLELHDALRKEKQFCNSLIRYKLSPEVIELSMKRMQKIKDEINAVSNQIKLSA